MGSGLIYLAIVIVWAAILIPMFLRSRDARTGRPVGGTL